MNLGTITNLAAIMAGDASQARYKNYTNIINIAQQQFCIDSKCLWGDWPATNAVNNQANYALPADFMFEKKVTFNGIGLTPISRQQLEIIYRSSDWTQVTGTPIYYVIDPDVSKNQLVLVPVPQNIDAGKAIVLTYYPYPKDLAVSADVPFNSNLLLAQFHIGLCAWTAWMLLMGEQQITPAVESKQKALLQVYNDCVSQAEATFQNTSSMPPRMRGVRAY